MDCQWQGQEFQGTVAGEAIASQRVATIDSRLESPEESGPDLSI